MSVSVAESYRQCRQIARQTAKNFYYSFLLMPPEKRAAMCAIYAFMRRSDDIADDAPDPATALAGLRDWRGLLDRALASQPVEEPTLPALADTVERYRINPKHIHDLLTGTELDQSKVRYETFEELYRYCYHVASCVGLVVLPVFGYEDQQAERCGEACGIAFQLTNIIRDVREDAGMGRIYLPLEDLNRFGVSEEEIMNRTSSTRFRDLMQFQAERARRYYAEAAPLVDLIHRDKIGRAHV